MGERSTLEIKQIKNNIGEDEEHDIKKNKFDDRSINEKWPFLWIETCEIVSGSPVAGKAPVGRPVYDTRTGTGGASLRNLIRRDNPTLTPCFRASLYIRSTCRIFITFSRTFPCKAAISGIVACSCKRDGTMSILNQCNHTKLAAAGSYGNSFGCLIYVGLATR